MSIEDLADILLEDTFVLAWEQGPKSLNFYVLASLLQTHPEASPPAAGEWACYRPGIIQFSGVSFVHGLLRQESVHRSIDADGAVDYGCIDSLSLIQPGKYHIAGDFGDVSVAARDVSIFLVNPAQQER